MTTVSFPGRFTSNLKAFAFFVLAIVLFATSAFAQITGALSGTVTDQSGALVPKATISLVNDATQSKRDSVSNSTGYFSFAGLTPGTYTLTVEAASFKVWSQTGIAIHPGDNVNIADIQLAIGASTERVTVEATGVTVQPTSGERSETLTAKDVDLLPLSGRNLSELLKVLPGVTTTAPGLGNGSPINFLNVGAQGSSVGTGLAPNGVPNRGGTSLLQDGANIIDPGCNCWSVATVNPDMTQEVTVQTSNFGADTAKGPVVVNNIGKAGSAAYHGSGYFYARNDALNAIDWQTENNANNAPTPVEPQKGSAHYYYPGFNFGGPVPFTHKKLLFWFGYEHFLQNTGSASVLTATIPTPAMMGGDFTSNGAGNSVLCPNLDANGNDVGSPQHPNTVCGSINGMTLPDGTVVTNGVIPSQYLDPGAKVLSSFWPTANLTPQSTAAINWQQATPGIHNGYVYRTRVDYDLSEKDKFFVSWQYGNDSQLAQGNGAHIWWTPQNAIPFPGGSINSQAFSKVLTGHFLHVFSPTLTNELVGSWGWGNSPLSASDFSAVQKSTLQYPYSSTIFNTTATMIPSYNSAGGGTFPDFSQADIFEGGGGSFIVRKEMPSISDNLTKVWRNHTFKAGFFWERVGNFQGNYLFPNGIFSFGGANPNAVTGDPMGSANNPTADFLTGIANNYNENNINPYNDIAYKTIAFYLNDSWKLTRRLTVDLGLRFDHQSHWYDRAGIGVAVFEPGLVASDAADPSHLYPGLRWHGIDPSVPLAGEKDKALYYSPRFGMAYDVFGTGKTVVRGGWGAYRFNDQYNDFANGLGPGQNVRSFNLPGASTVLLSQLGSLTAPSQTWNAAGNPGVTALDLNDKEIPVTYSWNLTVSQQLPWRSVLEVAYVGNDSEKLLMGGQSGATVQAGDFANQNKMSKGALFLPDPVTGVTATNPEDVTSVGNQLRDYAPFGNAYGTGVITVPTHVGYGNYNALQTSWIKQSGRLSFNLNYTFSKTLGTALQSDPFSVRGNYGVVAIDRPHVINTSFSYNMPDFYRGNKFLEGAVGGWTVASITTWQAGGNIQALYSSQSANLGLNLGYCDPGPGPVFNPQCPTPLPPGVNTNLGDATYFGTTAGIAIMPQFPCDPKSGLADNQHMNLDCFALPDIGSNGPRNMPYLSGPAYFNSDLALYKTFHITEKQNVQLRFSAFNWLNHPLPIFSGSNQPQLSYRVDYQTGDVSTTVANPALWGFTDQKAGAPSQRIWEMSIKYSF